MKTTYAVFLTERGNPRIFDTKEDAVAHIEENAERTGAWKVTLQERTDDPDGRHVNFKFEYYRFGKKVVDKNKCPYCGCRIELTEDKRYVNGIQPIFLNQGCEFCSPLPLDDPDCIFEEVEV